MKLRRSALVLLALAVASSAWAQVKQKPNSPARRMANAPSRELMQRIWDAWGTLDPANAAPFYSKDPQNIYFDITPMQYTGWAAYEKGVKNVLAGFRQFKATIPDDARVQVLGNHALGFTAWHAELVMADGTPSTMEGRWTVEWARENGRWLIVHEHVSVPMGGGPMPPGNKPLSPKVQ